MSTNLHSAPESAPAPQSAPQASASQRASQHDRAASRAKDVLASPSQTNYDLAHQDAIGEHLFLTAADSGSLGAAPDSAPYRPNTRAPIYHQIPAELQARPQWVVWAWALDKNGKWTKIPHNPKSGAKASTSAPRTWGTFAQAKAAYLENPIGLAGVGYVFAKDDPYVGVDLDHCRDAATGAITAWAQAWLDRFPTYAEISPSQTGIKLIVRGTHPAARGIKKPLGEMYAHGRFFTVTGATLESHTQVAEAQAAIDALYTELRGSTGASKPTRDGSAGDGDRAALAASHPDSEWNEGRRLNRTDRDRLLKRFLLSTKKEGTQGYFAARVLWAELHRRWSFIGLYRADGALDESQCRAVMARTIYGRGFTFAEYTVIMSYHFAAYCLAKWGTKQAWREELAALWQNAIEATPYTPRGASPKRDVAKRRKPKGRASNHGVNVDRIYQLLLEQRIGNKAIVKTADLAAATGMHRVTIAGILAELRDAKRISTERLGQYGGLVVSFSDVAIVADLPIATPTEAAPLEETRDQACVSSESREVGYSSEPPTLAQLAADYLAAAPEDVGKRIVSADGVVTYRRTAKHFADTVCAEYPAIAYADALAAHRTEQERLRQIELEAWRVFFAELKAMTNEELIAYIAGRCHAQVAELAREKHDKAAFDIGLYKARLKVARQHLAWRGLTMPAKRTRTQEAAEQAQRDVAQQAKAHRQARRPVACQPTRYEQPQEPPQQPAGTLPSLLAGIRAYHAAKAVQR